MRRQFLKFCALGILSAPWLMAHAAQLGRDYTELGEPINTDSGPKIEVTEFFWYGCPHCFALEPSLNAWLKKLPKDVAFRRIPAVLNNSWANAAKVWYTLKAMGVAQQYHDDFFNAVHLDGLNPQSEISIFNWAKKMGMNPQHFADTFNSFGVQSEVARAAQLVREAQITGVPTFMVNGRYLTSASLTGGEDGLFHTLDDLIVMVRHKRHD